MQRDLYTGRATEMYKETCINYKETYGFYKDTSMCVNEKRSVHRTRKRDVQRDLHILHVGPTYSKCRSYIFYMKESTYSICRRPTYSICRKKETYVFAYLDCTAFRKRPTYSGKRPIYFGKKPPYSFKRPTYSHDCDAFHISKET